MGDESKPDFNEILKKINDDDITLEDIDVEYSNITVTDDNVNDFILDRASELVDDGVAAVKSLKQRILAAQDSDEINALSQLIKATNSALKTLTDISLQNKREKAAQRNIEQKKLKGPSTVNNTLIVGTREDALKQIMSAVGGKVIDVRDENE